MIPYAEILPMLCILLLLALSGIGLGVINWWAERRQTRRWRLKYHERMRG